MKKEKVILSFIATLIGLMFAGVAFYFYESSKDLPPSTIKKISIVQPTPTPKPSIFLSLDRPKDEEVVSKKVITISGKTIPEAIVSIIAQNSQDIITPALNGDFSTTINVEDGQNLIEITAIAPNGESAKALRTVTFSTEEF
ncbi:MAG: hypothetical protein AAB600_05500 [Patescibacteria group bacterium]